MGQLELGEYSDGVRCRDVHSSARKSLRDIFCWFFLGGMLGGWSRGKADGGCRVGGG